MPAKRLPRVAYLRECFSYDPETGSLHWKARPLKHFVDLHTQLASNGRFAGKEAGYAIDGSRRTVMINQQNYYAHRIIYKMMTGKEPGETIDHRFGDESDNRWEILRKATWAQQVWNRGMKSNNTSGYRGVFRAPNGKWYTKIFFKGKTYCLGTYDTPEAASVVFEAKARELHGEFYREISPNCLTPQ